MTRAKKTKPTTLQVRHPSHEKGELQYVGGSRSDAFNNVLIRQALNSLWLAHVKSPEDTSNLYGAAAAALVGIGPKDELEGMLAAQMIAAHSAAMQGGNTGSPALDEIPEPTLRVRGLTIWRAFIRGTGEWLWLRTLCFAISAVGPLLAVSWLLMR